jgi:hypothetical protein
LDFLVAMPSTALIDRRGDGLEGHQVGRLAPYARPHVTGVHHRCLRACGEPPRCPVG